MTLSVHKTAMVTGFPPNGKMRQDETVLNGRQDKKPQTDKNIAAKAKDSVREASLIFGDSWLLSKRRKRGDGRETLGDIQ